MGAKEIMPKVINICNIVVGSLTAISGIIQLTDFFDNTSLIEYLFLSLCVIAFGVGLILVEVGYKRGFVYAYLGLLRWYAGRGFFVLL